MSISKKRAKRRERKQAQRLEKATDVEPVVEVIASDEKGEKPPHKFHHRTGSRKFRNQVRKANPAKTSLKVKKAVKPTYLQKSLSSAELRERVQKLEKVVEELKKWNFDLLNQQKVMVDTIRKLRSKSNLPPELDLVKFASEAAR